MEHCEHEEHKPHPDSDPDVPPPTVQADGDPDVPPPTKPPKHSGD